MSLNKFRQEIDEINRKIIELLAKRFALSAKVAQIKKEQDLPIIDENRETQMYKQLEIWAKEREISPELVKKIFNLIVDEAYQQQKEILKSSPR
jgi:chorismate mutase